MTNYQLPFNNYQLPIANNQLPKGWLPSELVSYMRNTWPSIFFISCIKLIICCLSYNNNSTFSNVILHTNLGNANFMKCLKAFLKMKHNQNTQGTGSSMPNLYLVSVTDTISCNYHIRSSIGISICENQRSNW